MSITERNGSIKPASEYTVRQNREFAAKLGLSSENTVNNELELAYKNCILPIGDNKVIDSDGNVVFDPADYSFFDRPDAPDTVNPSLWINGKSNRAAGVFEVIKDKIYQVRGLDIANFTVVRSKTGWIGCRSRKRRSGRKGFRGKDTDNRSGRL